MNILNLFKRSENIEKEEISNSVETFNHLWNMDISDIWDITNVDSFMTAMNGWLCKKCDCGSNMSCLTKQECAVYHIIQLRAEVYNGGFLQYLYYACGDIYRDLIPSLKMVNANKTAEICRRVLTIFKQGIPEDKENREKFLQEFITDEMEAILSECDDEFYKENDDIENLNYKFIMDNSSHFTN